MIFVWLVAIICLFSSVALTFHSACPGSRHDAQARRVDIRTMGFFGSGGRGQVRKRPEPPLRFAVVGTRVKSPHRFQCFAGSFCVCVCMTSREHLRPRATAGLAIHPPVRSQRAWKRRPAQSHPPPSTTSPTSPPCRGNPPESAKQHAPPRLWIRFLPLAVVVPQGQGQPPLFEGVASPLRSRWPGP